jgi:hypothetical protein
MELPTGSEDEIMSAAVARARLSDLETQISALEISLRNLRREREALHDQLDAYRYPVLTLPNEITSEIFSHFLPAYPQLPPLIGRLSAFTLGHICGKWREIALSTPSLWRSIIIDVDEEMPDAIRLHLLKLWLQRSGLQPISFALTYVAADTTLSPIIETVAQHIHRCEEMDLHLSMADLVALQSPDMPLLHTLTLNSHQSSRLRLFDQVPKLTTITLGVDFSPFRIILPWSQITTLRGVYLLGGELAEILRLAVNLVHCSARLQQFVDQNLPVVAPHLHLQDLILTPYRLSDDYNMATIAVFDKLTLPALRRLRVSEPWFGPNPAASLAEWVSRSGCGLQQLEITHSTTSENSYREVLPLVPKISIYRSDVDSDNDVADSSGSDGGN